MKELKHVAEITISYKPLRPKMPIVKTSLEAYTELKEFFPPDLINLQEQFVVMYFNKGAEYWVSINSLHVALVVL